MFNQRIFLSILLVFMCASVQSLALNAAERETSAESVVIAGLYRCEGDGYKGTVSITEVGDTYLLRWKLGTKTHVGVAIRYEDMLASSWSPGSGIPGIVVYKIDQGPRLIGQYSSYPGNGQTKKETLTFLKRLPRLPSPRVWQVNETPLVNWSCDVYWYPATIVKKEGNRYFVHFDDGDKEWTDASRMIEEDITVGDRVFGNWKGRGRYYAGTVTTRNGKTIHIKYDDGDEETTTISFVRVIRPKEQ